MKFCNLSSVSCPHIRLSLFSPAMSNPAKVDTMWTWKFLLVKLLVRQPLGLPDLFLRPWYNVNAIRFRFGNVLPAEDHTWFRVHESCDPTQTVTLQGIQLILSSERKARTKCRYGSVIPHILESSREALYEHTFQRSQARSNEVLSLFYVNFVPRHEHILDRYDTIREAVLTCARKLT